MAASRHGLLRRQSDLTRALFEHHPERLEPEDLLREPVPRCWTVRPAAGGGWVPDWAETEPDPVPVPTIAWLSRHIGWWWGTAADHARGRAPRARTGVAWPGGEAADRWLRELRADWLEALEGLGGDGLDAAAPFPWPDGSGRSVADMAAWGNAEPMRNAAEIGQLRLLRAAGRA
ncbi:DinB family protein [Streptomyces desertarenae]|uniref:DinB family protein n=1 Tax=Streptomyces desertarenae TaxID=2666184 RepID=A0ABW4PF43_9ACTN